MMPIQPRGKLTVLAIEDDPAQLQAYEQILGPKVKLIKATTLDEAYEQVVNHHEIDIILADGCLIEPGLSDEERKKVPPNTAPVIRDFRLAGFKGPIIAVAADPDYREHQLGAGATESYTKSQAVFLVLNWLKNPAIMSQMRTMSIEAGIATLQMGIRRNGIPFGPDRSSPA